MFMCSFYLGFFIDWKLIWHLRELFDDSFNLNFYWKNIMLKKARDNLFNLEPKSIERSPDSVNKSDQKDLFDNKSEEEMPIDNEKVD